jgi:hypothetical protein
MPYNVFVSYSTKDIPNVDQLRQFLQVPDVQCFVSEYSVKPGAPLAPTIKTAILACDLFILRWSKNAAASECVSQENRYRPRLSEAHSAVYAGIGVVATRIYQGASLSCRIPES